MKNQSKVLTCNFCGRTVSLDNSYSSKGKRTQCSLCVSVNAGIRGMDDFSYVTKYIHLQKESGNYPKARPLINRRTALNRIFQLAQVFNCKYVAVEIQVEGNEGLEVIINPTENFSKKLDYYENAYTKDLVLKNAQGIRIVDACFANSYDEIEGKFEYHNRIDKNQP